MDSEAIPGADGFGFDLDFPIGWDWDTDSEHSNEPVDPDDWAKDDDYIGY